MVQLCMYMMLIQRLDFLFYKHEKAAKVELGGGGGGSLCVFFMPVACRWLNISTHQKKSITYRRTDRRQQKCKNIIRLNTFDWM